MITVMILNKLVFIVNTWVGQFFGPVASFFNNVNTSINALTVPQTLLDVFFLVAYFLPLGTISLLAGITFCLVIVALVLSVIHFFAHILNII